MPADDPGGAPRLAAQAFGRLAAACACPGVEVRVLAQETLVAYAFRAGVVFVSRGLVARLGADELAAAIAHELGHLTREGDALAARDAEAQADRLGVALLEASGVPPGAMAHLLRRLADARPGAGEGLRARIAALEARPAGAARERVALR